MPASPARAAAAEDRRRSRDLARLILVVVVAAVAALAIPSADVRLYEHYATQMVHGSLVHGLPREYPALAGFVFVAALVPPVPYALAVALLMAAALVALVVAGRRLAPDVDWTRRLLWYLGLATVSLLFARYDLLPALAAFLAVMWARDGRWGRAWVAAGAGAALQLFPALLLPGFFLLEWRRTGRAPWRKPVLACVVTAATAALQTLIAPGSFLDPIRYELRRGFELASVPGSITAVIDPAHLRWAFAYGNREILGTGHSEIQVAITIVELCALAAVWLAAWRGRFGVEATSLAVLSVAVLCDSALAPQYLIWLAPLWALWPLRRSWVVAAVLTALTFPIAYSLEPYFGSFLAATLLALARNAVLIAGTVAWAHDQIRAKDEAAAHRQSRTSTSMPPLGIMYGASGHADHSRRGFMMDSATPTPAGDQSGNGDQGVLPASLEVLP